MSKNEDAVGTIGEKMARLEESVEWFNSDEFVLEEATAKYQEALELAKEIKGDLAELKNDIEIIDSVK